MSEQPTNESKIGFLKYLMQTGQVTPARKMLENLQDQFKENCDLYEIQALLDYQVGQLSHACQAWEKSLDLDPNRGEALLCSAVAAADTGDYERAQNRFSRTKAEVGSMIRDQSTKDTLAGAHLKTALLYLDIGMVRNGEEELFRAIQIHPSHHASRLVLIQLLLDKNEFSRAFAFIQEGIKMDPELPDYWYWTAIANYLSENNPAAKEAIQKCLYYDPDHRPAKVIKKLLEYRPVS